MKLHSIVNEMTNSSSTTFIVGFKEIPTTLGQVLDTLFPDGRDFVVAYDRALPVLDVCYRVLEDIKTADRIETKEQFIQEISIGYFPGYPDYRNSESYQETQEINQKYRLKYGKNEKYWDHEDWKQELFEDSDRKRAIREKEIQQAAEKFADTSWAKMENLHKLIFSYADDGGDSVLEHGDIFNELDHVTISHH